MARNIETLALPFSLRIVLKGVPDVLRGELAAV
jgi:hypothetical protein